MARCLFCYRELKDEETDFHGSCAKKIFGTNKVPEISITCETLKLFAEENIQSRNAIAGVQAKLSMYLDTTIRKQTKLTIVGFAGNYILKPQSEKYPNLPENEDLSMHLAECVGIKTVPHSLIRLKNNELCYITKRIDRTKEGKKVAMEDMAQLTQRLSEDKYKSSYEQIAKTIRLYSSIPGFDIGEFAKQVLFAWIIGNSDMHLKNFSLINENGKWKLSPAYDLLNVKLAMPKDKEELALILNGKGGEHQYKASDFKKAFETFGLTPTTIDYLFNFFVAAESQMHQVIKTSFLPQAMQQQYAKLISARLKRLAS